MEPNKRSSMFFLTLKQLPWHLFHDIWLHIIRKITKTRSRKVIKPSKSDVGDAHMNTNILGKILISNSKVLIKGPAHGVHQITLTKKCNYKLLFHSTPYHWSVCLTSVLALIFSETISGVCVQPQPPLTPVSLNGSGSILSAVCLSSSVFAWMCVPLLLGGRDGEKQSSLNR